MCNGLISNIPLNCNQIKMCAGQGLLWEGSEIQAGSGGSVHTAGVVCAVKVFSVVVSMQWCVYEKGPVNEI